MHKDKMRLDTSPDLQADRVFQATELMTWRRSIGRVRFAVGPFQLARSNPCQYEDMLLAATFAPARVAGIDRETGTLRWRLELPGYGRTPYVAANTLYATTCGSLFAVEPQSGKVLWNFTPDVEGSERMYSSPIVANGRLFIGDRAGRLHCLDAATGQSIWSVLTSRASNRQVNATAVVLGDTVYIATNATLVTAFEAATGRLMWRRHIAHRCITELRLYAGMLLVETAEALYGLCPETGAHRMRWRWLGRPGREIRGVAVAGARLLVATSTDYGLRTRPPGWKSSVPREHLVAFNGQTELWSLPYDRPWSFAGMAWSATTNLLYETTLGGEVGIVCTLTGRRLAKIRSFEAAGYRSADRVVAIPGADADFLYVLSDNGIVWKLHRLNACSARL